MKDQAYYPPLKAIVNIKDLNLGLLNLRQTGHQIPNK